MEFNVVFMDPLKSMLTKIADFIPSLFGALIIFVVGWIIARILRLIVKQFLGLIRFDILAEKGGIADILAKGGIKTTASQVLSGLVYWLLIIIVLALSLDALGLETVSSLLDQLLGYLPFVIAAVFVLVVGMFLSAFVSGIVSTAAGGAHIPQPQLLGNISKYIIIIFAVVIALKQLQLETDLLDQIVLIAIGAVGFALAISFGLGCKDIAGRYMDDALRKKSS